jgi:GntR family transcriptional repressor for pyruvate dehydrogenase complex
MDLYPKDCAERLGDGEAMVIQPVIRITMGEMVLQRLIDLLQSGNYKSGEKLPTEMALSKQLNVSRPVLRQAINTLRHLGYLESVQGGGTYISKTPFTAAISNIKLKLALESTQLLDISELRYILEVEVAGLAAERATDNETAAINNAMKIYKENVENGSSNSKTIEATKNFHALIAKATHNSTIIFLMDSIAGLLTLSREKTIQVKGSSNRAAKYHKRIAEAIAEHNAEKARMVMREHMLDVRRDLAAYLKNSGQ